MWPALSLPTSFRAPRRPLPQCRSDARRNGDHGGPGVEADANSSAHLRRPWQDRRMGAFKHQRDRGFRLPQWPSQTTVSGHWKQPPGRRQRRNSTRCSQNSDASPNMNAGRPMSFLRIVCRLIRRDPTESVGPLCGTHFWRQCRGPQAMKRAVGNLAHHAAAPAARPPMRGCGWLTGDTA